MRTAATQLSISSHRYMLNEEIDPSFKPTSKKYSTTTATATSMPRRILKNIITPIFGSESVSISRQKMNCEHQGKLQHYNEHDPAFATKVTIHPIFPSIARKRASC